MKRANILLTGCAIVLAAGAVAIVWLTWLQPSPMAAPTTAVVATAEITRGPLRDTKTVTGTLSYGDLTTLRAAEAETRMLTWIAPVGATVERGQPLYRVDGEPRLLFFGALPLARTLRFDIAGDAPVWVELEEAASAVQSAELSLSLEQQRLAEAEARLTHFETRLADADAPTPATPEIIQLTGAIVAATDRLARVRELVSAQLAPAADLATAETAFAAARSALDATLNALRKDAANARLDAATARVAIADATAKRDAQRIAHETLAARIADSADIQQLADNLTALGYAGALPEQVRAWQRDTGLPATGMVRPQHLIVAPGPVHVAAHRAGVGESVAVSSAGGGAILEYSSVEKLVTVPLAVADQALAAPGRGVTVTLPDDTKVGGTITEIGSIVTDGAIDIKIAIADQAALAALEIAAVDVEFVSAGRDGVLSVPITALLARPEGGFAVEIVDKDATYLAAIDTGLFASGRVEVTGDGIAEGMRVSVPR